MNVRRWLRVVVVLASAGLVGWLASTARFESRSVLFQSVGAQDAHADERVTGALGKLRLLTRSVGWIQSSYVVPARARPRAMLIGALRGAEATVPDLMVTPDADTPEQARAVEVRVGDNVRRFAVDDVDSLYQMNWRLLDVFAFVAEHLPADVKPEDVEYAAINGMLGPLDEHSTFLPPDAYREMKLDTEGRFGGLGIVITSRQGVVTVVSVMEGTPAAAAGLRTGDRIVEVGDESTMNMDLSAAVSRLRGEPGTEVAIRVERKEWDEPRAFTLTRAEIRVRGVTHEDLGDGVGYVRIRNFQEDTAEQVARAIEALRDAGAGRGVVLDLRQNPGGLLDQAVEVANLFVREGTLVVTEAEGKRRREEYAADGEAPFPDLPVVVLIDGGSASAAEIVAGALKNNDRAVVVGSTSFGKGTVQVMYDIADGALKLTVAQYLTPGDLSIQGVGVVPDLELLPVAIGRRHVTMGLLDERRPRDPSRRLEAFGPVAEEPPARRLFYLVDDVREEDEDEDEPPVVDTEKFRRDEVIDMAAGLVRHVGATGRGGLAGAAAALDRWTAGQDARISARMAEWGADWAAGPVRPDAPVRIAWAVVPEGPLQAGADVRLRLTAVNDGEAPLFRVHCMTESDADFLDGREFVFGRLEPGRPVVREVPIRVPPDAWDRDEQVRFRLFQQERETASPAPVRVRVEGLPRPRFAYAVQVQDAGGDGMLDAGETATVIVDVRNVGRGPALRVLSTLRNPEQESGINIRKGRERIDGGIPVDGTVQARFRVEVRPDRQPGPAALEIAILDTRLREFLSEKIALDVGPAGRTFPREPASPWRVAGDGVPIRAAARADAPVLFHVPAGFLLRGTGRVDDFVRVDVDAERFGFVAASAVTPEAGAERFSVLPAVPVATHVQPELDVTFTTSAPPGDDGRPRARVAGQVRFAGHDGEARRKVLVFRGNDKVHFWTRQGPTTEAVVDIDTMVPLVEGRNDLAVFAVEGKDRTVIRRYSVFVPPWKKTDETAAGTAGGGEP